MMKTNLTREMNAFMGRTSDMEAIDRLWEQTRLVTLTGTGGVGKTRLAVEYGMRCAPEYAALGASGVWLCDLTEVRSLEELCAVVAMTLEVSLVSCPTVKAAVEQLGRALAGRERMLLILDNAEQVVEHAPAALPRWLTLAPETRVLVTSRERLRVAGEWVLELEPLDIDTEAVRLFVDRAAALRAETWDADAQTAIRDIVRRLDGIPLAIELAAARVGIMSPHQIRERLEQQFALLAVGNRGAHTRQATLRGAIDGSWQLLRPEERIALAQCSVFRGGFALAAAEAIVELPQDDAGRTVWVMDALQALREKSLLRAQPVAELGGEQRFRLFESIRQYAAEQLVEAHAPIRRHAEYYARRGMAWAERSWLVGGEEALRRLELERENISLALERACDGVVGEGSRQMALQAALALEPLMRAHDRAEHHVMVLTRAFGWGFPPQTEADGSLLLPTVEDPTLVARLLMARGTALRMRGASEEAIRSYGRAAALALELGALGLSGRALCFKGALLENIGRHGEALELHHEALERVRQADDALSEGVVLTNMAGVAHSRGQLDEAERLYLKAQRLVESSGGGLRHQALVLGNLAGVSIARGELEDARARYTEVLAMAHTLRDRWLEAVVLGHLGSLAQEEGQLDEAERCLRQALVHQRELGARPQEGLSLGYLGVLLHERGQLCEARDCYQRAIAVLDEVDDGLGVSYVWFHRAALEAAEGNIEAVAHCRRKADEGLGDLGSDKSAPMQAMVEAHVAYAQMRQALEEGRSQEAHRLEQTITTILAHMRQPEGELAPPVARFDGVRSMLRLVEQGLAQLQPPDGALLVCRDGGWFRPPHEAWIDYRRRRSLKRLLVALTEHRISAPGVGVELATMIEAGWPNEPLSEEVGANRVYVAVTTLRKAGLHDILHSSDTGWFLDAATPVLWADGPEEG